MRIIAFPKYSPHPYRPKGLIVDIGPQTINLLGSGCHITNCMSICARNEVTALLMHSIKHALSPDTTYKAQTKNTSHVCIFVRGSFPGIGRPFEKNKDVSSTSTRETQYCGEPP